MTNLEKILIEKIRHLPPEKQRDMLEFAETLSEAEEIREVTTIWDKKGASEQNARSASRKTIWEIVRDIVEEVPEEEWAKLPTDGSVNVDHYLYGHKKRSL